MVRLTHRPRDRSGSGVPIRCALAAARQTGAGPGRRPARCAHLPARGLLIRIVLALAALATSLHAQAPHLNRPVRGGMPGLPILTGIEWVTNGLRLTWEGPPGYYRVEYRTALDAPWQPLTPATNFGRITTVPAPAQAAFFRIAGPAPHYAGAEACATCHAEIHAEELQTRHAHALESLERVGQADNPACLPCHTVGYGLPGGFVSRTLTPHLGGVQCESCHGPAGLHAANENDPLFRPRVEIAAQMCGGCHNQDSHRTHFEQWAGSAHATVTEDMNPPNRINSCGRCHSGSSRIALLKGADPAATVTGDANMPVTCVVCHDPHRRTGHPAQLRNPLASFTDYSLGTGANFATAYDPDIQLCAQCHNQRGATWTSNTRPPHHSPQYNMLLGTAGLVPEHTASRPAAHAFLEKQCVSCHMPAEGGRDEQHPAFAAHTFRVESFDSCLGCHPAPEALVDFTRSLVDMQIQRVKAALDLWALTRAPEPLRQYGPRAWEYNIPGSLSNPTGSPQIRGPRSSNDPAQDEQALIPDRIRKARFNLYLVAYDGSHGVHNGPHAALLLDAALQWVAEELQMPPAAAATLAPSKTDPQP
ncbi:multiheme c-type cytochrome [Limisphaera sp. 4302-co]|uniref:multiheme c-type cytochrome n=1 Tax=Limisphaera sp. 4302-co TaxID=3400417 RepID=UPI003C2772A7